jgi:hypothetical protein
MHAHLLRVIAHPVPRADVTQRSARVITLEARRHARLQLSTA